MDAHPARLHEWCILAKEVEINQNRNLYHSRKAWKWSPPEKKGEITKALAAPAHSTACFKCGKKDIELWSAAVTL